MSTGDEDQAYRLLSDSHPPRSDWYTPDGRAAPGSIPCSRGADGASTEPAPTLISLGASARCTTRARSGGRDMDKPKQTRGVYDSICSVGGCDEDSKTRGLCGFHYERNRAGKGVSDPRGHKHPIGHRRLSTDGYILVKVAATGDVHADWDAGAPRRHGAVSRPTSPSP